MIVLDTNVISELISDKPSSKVISWLAALDPDDIWTTSITIYELVYGFERMPESKRRTTLELRHAHLMRKLIENRVAELDELAANEAGRIRAERERTGQPNTTADFMIAGIAMANRATVATRNIRHFTGLTVPVVDPWAAGSA